MKEREGIWSAYLFNGNPWVIPETWGHLSSSSCSPAFVSRVYPTMQQVGTDGAQLPLLMGQAQVKWVISLGDVKYGSLKYHLGTSEAHWVESSSAVLGSNGSAWQWERQRGESQNHRISPAGRGPQGSLGPSPGTNQGHPQLAHWEKHYSNRGHLNATVNTLTTFSQPVRT